MLSFYVIEKHEFFLYSSLEHRLKNVNGFLQTNLAPIGF